MAGSRSSPVLRDQWSAASNPGDRRFERERTGSRREGFKGKPNERSHHPSRGGTDSKHRHRSPPPSRSTFRPSRETPYAHPRRESSPGGSHTSSRPQPFEDDAARPGSRRPAFAAENLDFDRSRPSGARVEHRSPRRDDSPSAPPPSKRQRTRSPSPRGQNYHHPPPPPSSSRHHQPHHRLSRHGEHRDRSPPQNKRGRLPARGASGRPAPRRGKPRRDFDPGLRRGNRGRYSRPSARGGRRVASPFSRSPSPDPRDLPDQGSRHRSLSRHSFQSTNSRISSFSRRDSRSSPMMSSTRPIQSVVNESTRSPSPPRPIPSFDAENSTVAPDGEAFPMHGMRVSDAHSGQRSRPPRPHGGNRQYSTSPQYVTSNSSYQGSPPPHSPYSGGRGSWNGQSYHGQHGHSPPYRQNSYSAQGGSQNSYYQNNQSSYNGPGNSTQQPFSGPSYRGGHSNYRGNHPNQGPDRRFGTHGSQGFSNGPPQRGRGHFSNLQWTASGSRGRGDQRSPLTSHNQPPASPSQPASSGNKMSPSLDDDDRPFRPSSKDLPVEEEGPKTTQDLENGDDLRIPPPVQQSNQSETPNKGGKFSFAFKAKTTPVAVPKPVPDLAQRMQVREPPPRAAEPPQRSRMPLGPPPKFRHDTRFDPRDRDRNRDRTRDRERDRGRERPPREREDRREFREPRGPREPRDRRHPRRDDRRFNQQFEKKNERRHEMPLGRHRELSPEPPLEPARPTKILTRVKPRPTLSEEFSQSDSVYFRKPGNESVIGAGTYGKVFKAIHIYTKKMVALKKIRMEGEKDGFPVTAVREIKLLQHLRNPNVVSLLEVMVEKNECFMVFEYLSHDLTGLINHPTFTLTEAHKKNLAQQMFAGLEYLHHRGVLHRDIKAANILISNTGLLKFADFGLARFFSKSRELDYTNRVVTIWYRPPELLLGETRYGPAVDVWSAACVYIELFTKKAVFPGEGGEISQLDKLYNCLGTPTRAEWPDIVEMPWFELMRPTERKKRIFEDLYRSILSPAALDMVSQILSYDPAKRPSAEQVLQHPYFVSEEPSPQQAIELQNIEGDWHEFESKALRKEKDKEARRAEYQKEKEKRKATTGADSQGERDSKRAKQDADSSQHV